MSGGAPVGSGSSFFGRSWIHLLHVREGSMDFWLTANSRCGMEEDGKEQNAITHSSGNRCWGKDFPLLEGRFWNPKSHDTESMVSLCSSL